MKTYIGGIKPLEMYVVGGGAFSVCGIFISFGRGGGPSTNFVFTRVGRGELEGGILYFHRLSGAGFQFKQIMFSIFTHSLCCYTNTEIKQHEIMKLGRT